MICFKSYNYSHFRKFVAKHSLIICLVAYMTLVLEDGISAIFD